MTELKVEMLDNRELPTRWVVQDFVCGDGTMLSIKDEAVDRRGPVGVVTLLCNGPMAGPSEYWWRYKDTVSRALSLNAALAVLQWNILHHCGGVDMKVDPRLLGTVEGGRIGG